MPAAAQAPSLARQAAMARHMAAGVAGEVAAKAAGIAREVSAQIRESRLFLAILCAFQVPRLLPAEEVLPSLVKLANGVLFRRIAEDQDARVAAWFSWWLDRCVNPVKLLAEQVWRCLSRKPAQATERTPVPSPVPPAWTLERQLLRHWARVSAGLRSDMYREMAAQGVIAADRAGEDFPGEDEGEDIPPPPPPDPFFIRSWRYLTVEQAKAYEQGEPMTPGEIAAGGVAPDG